MKRLSNGQLYLSLKVHLFVNNVGDRGLGNVCPVFQIIIGCIFILLLLLLCRFCKFIVINILLVLNVSGLSFSMVNSCWLLVMRGLNVLFELSMIGFFKAFFGLALFIPCHKLPQARGAFKWHL